MAKLDDALVAFTPARAAQVTGLSRRQVDYWRQTLLLAPSTDERISARRSIRLYDFTDMVALMTVAELLQRDVSLQRVRHVVGEMRQRGLENPLTQLRFGTVNKANTKRKHTLVALTLQDGTVVGDDDVDQGVFAEAISIDQIRARIRRGSPRGEDSVGQFEKKRETRNSREVFVGTRVPVDAVRSFLADGVPTDEILEAFPTLQRGDIDAVRAAG